MRLLVASSNSKKLKELKELLADLGLELISLAEMLHVVEVEEDGSSFQENAEKKALGYAKQTGCLTLADDSGLTVDYLKGDPGIHSARFSGSEKNDYFGTSCFVWASFQYLFFCRLFNCSVDCSSWNWLFSTESGKEEFKRTL